MAFITLRQANVVNSPNAIIKNSPLSNAEVDNNFANINVEVSDLGNTVANLSTTTIVNGNSNVNIGTADGPIEISANFLPLIANIFDLGSPTQKFKDLYLDGNLYFEGELFADTGVTAATYGNATLIPTFTVGNDGRITDASNIEIIGGATLANDTTTDLSFFPTLSSTTSGSFTTATVSDTKLFFNPSTGILNATDFNSLSDATLKINLQPIENAAALLKNISGVEFNWKDNKRKSAGVLAQQVEAILPHVVTESSNGFKSVNYGSLTAYLIQSVKELTARIEELEKKNDS